MSRRSAAGLAAATLVLVPALAGAASPSETERAQKEIWAKEQSIYSGRGAGNIGLYLNNTAAGYLAWPPFNEVPKGTEGLKATGRTLEGKTHEKLEMTLTGFALNGTTAVIYYKTHRTMLADGTPADQHYEVTHTWVRENGRWKVLGGMARLRPERPPGG
jgi:hypothetical protein